MTLIHLDSIHFCIKLSQIQHIKLSAFFLNLLEHNQPAGDTGQCLCLLMAAPVYALPCVT